MEIAERGDRIVRMLDGRVVGEDTPVHAPASELALAAR
jgi:hypothetical protein